MLILIAYCIFSYLWMGGFMNNISEEDDNWRTQILLFFMFILSPIGMPILMGYKTGN